MVNKKHAFWQALVISIIIFIAGLLLGLWLEEARTNKMEKILAISEINLLDSQLIGKVNENFNLSCEISKKQLFQFADKIYEEAQLLEQYDASSQLIDLISVMHKRYDLLRVMLWSESIKIKKECHEEFHTAIYFFQYQNPPISIKSQQTAFSRFLMNMKEKHGNNLLLIPIAGDLNLTSIDMLKTNFKIKTLPAILVDEKTLISSIEELEKIESYLNKSAKNPNRILLLPQAAPL